MGRRQFDDFTMAPNASSNQRSSFTSRIENIAPSDDETNTFMDETSNDAADVPMKSPLPYSTTANTFDLGRIRFGNAYPCMVALSVLVYWIFVSLIPVVNKYFFRQEFYPYPIATAGIQLGVVSILLGSLNTAQHFCFTKRQTQRRQTIISPSDDSRYQASDASTSLSSSSRKIDETPSWIFGPHLWYKLKYCFPIGVLFGLKYAFTNLGLHLVPAPTHLLLQSTDLVWTVLSAWVINGEVVSPVEIVCLAGCVAGSVVLGWQLQESSITAPLYAIAINLISPILLGLCLATLRLACTELMRPDNRLRGTVSAIELTAIKLVVSSVVGLMMACIMEGGDETRDPWWIAFAELTKSTRWGILGGAILISVFQINCTLLCMLTSAVALGLVGQVKIIPQWLLAALCSSRSSNSSFQFRQMNMVGALLIMGSAAAFALSNWIESSGTQTRNNSTCCSSMDEELGSDKRCCEEQPLLLLGAPNDFDTAIAQKSYCTIYKPQVSAGNSKTRK